MAYQKPVFLWKKAPFTRLLPALVMGILIGHYLQPSPVIVLSCLAVALLSLFFLSNQKVVLRYFAVPFSGLLWMLIPCFMGMLATHFNNIKNDKAWHGHYINDAKYWKVKVSSQPEEKEKTFKVLANVLTGYESETAVPVKGKVILYFSKDNLSGQIQQGDLLYIRNKLQPVKNSGNPGAFDYKKYLEYQQIFYQSILNNNYWKFSGQNKITWLEQLINTSLHYENDLFNKYLDGGQVKALAKALMTGDRSGLDKDLVQAYSDAGVVHIMSISGLHLGLIYIFLMQLVKIIPPISKRKIIKAILVLGGIWFFAILTGCSPSVMRSAVMFSCLHAGTLLNRKIPSYNFWSASAFLLLCFDPMLLWNVGFQLSYTAVLGILVAQRPIYHWITFENKIVDYCWQLVSVSLAAQIFTLPVCMFYFHQVPLLFIVANLIAIPLSSMGLWLSVLLVMTGWLPLIPVAIGKIISVVFGLLNDFITYMDSLVFTVWSGIYINLAETLLLLMIAISITVWLLRKSTTALKAFVISGWLLLISFAYSYWQISNQQRLVVYNVNAATAIDIISGKNYFEILEGNHDSRNVQFALAASRQYFGVKFFNPVQKKFVMGKNEFYTGSIPMMIIRSIPEKAGAPAKKIHLKAIVLSNANKVHIADLVHFFDADVYIFSALNKRSHTEKWKKECEHLHLRSHDIATQGAFVMNY